MHMNWNREMIQDVWRSHISSEKPLKGLR